MTHKNVTSIVKLFKYELINKDFETFIESKKERRIRIKIGTKLGLSNYYSYINSLSNCRKENRCKSPACPVCFRAFRKSLIPKLVRVYENMNSAKMLTIVDYDEVLPENSIDQLNILKIKEKLYQLLYRLNAEGPIVGGFEVKFEEDSGLWIPHFHLLVPSSLEREREHLKNFFNRNKNIERKRGVKNKPLQFDEIRNPAEQLSYLLKSFWPRCKKFKGSNSSSTFRLHPKHLVYTLELLNDAEYSQLLFRYRCSLGIKDKNIVTWKSKE